MTPTLQDILVARSRLTPHLYHTPLEFSPWLTELTGQPVWLKLECLQRTRSFKARGALNAIMALTPEQRGRGLVTASAGNHGQGAALAAGIVGVRCTIFVPEKASPLKVSRMVELGAEVRHVGANYDESAEAAHAHAESAGCTYIHAFSDPTVVAGQGTVGFEILEDLPGVQTVLAPVGGGGLIGGVGIAMKAANPAIRLLGVQTPPASSMYESFRAGRVVTAGLGESTIADGLHGGVDGPSFERARQLVEAMHLVEEDRLPAAIRELYRRHGVVAEPSGVVGIALLLTGTVRVDGPVSVIVTGGNVDPARLGRWLAGD